MMTRCIRPRAGHAWPLALPMIPYMRANLARKRTGLARADAVIAVSTTIAADLTARAPEIAATRMRIIPNPVNIAGLRARGAASTPPLHGPYTRFIWESSRPTRGRRTSYRVAEEAGLDWPLVIVGDGPERDATAAQAAGSGRDIRLIGWVDQDAATAWLSHASILIFTSRGPESLSRVLIEASALGVPIAAMNTGGTPDIVVDEETGLLSGTPEELAADVRRLRDDEELRRRLGAAAMVRAEACFDGTIATGRVEQLYRELIGRPAS